MNTALSHLGHVAKEGRYYLVLLRESDGGAGKAK